MAVVGLIIPEDRPWTEDDDNNSVHTLVYEAPAVDDGNWEVAGRPRLSRANAIVAENVAVSKWCRLGNACPWRNCKFRHERCVHYDNWVKRGKKGHNCRCYATDPESKKCPHEGGCMYDHRDMDKLRVFGEVVPVSTESDLWDNFMERGLEQHVSDVYDIRDLNKSDLDLLIRSLKAANIPFEYKKTYMYIYYTDTYWHPPDDE